MPNDNGTFNIKNKKDTCTYALKALFLVNVKNPMQVLVLSTNCHHMKLFNQYI